MNKEVSKVELIIESLIKGNTFKELNLVLSNNNFKPLSYSRIRYYHNECQKALKKNQPPNEIIRTIKRRRPQNGDKKNQTKTN